MDVLSVRQKEDMQSKAQEERHGGRVFAGWFVSAFIGTVVAFFSSGIVIPLVYGAYRRDSASVWMLSGVADLVIGFLSLPVFLVAHGIAFAMSKAERSTTSWRASRSAMIGLAVFWVVILVVWHQQGGGRVLRSQ